MRNIAEILMAQLSDPSLRHLHLIGEVADLHGVQAYLVGGAVRDALLGLPVSDIDIAVVGLTPELAQEAATKLGGEIVTRSQFNTFALSICGRRIDLAMARSEIYSRPGALPTVSHGSIEEDLARRDFTINAMAASINDEAFGSLLDPFGGKSDLNTGIVRALHDDSFRDDATRILRAVRYAVRMGFALDGHTENLLRGDASYLDTISPARLRDEFERVLGESRTVSTLRTMHELGALQAIHPALAFDASTRNALRRAEHSGYADKSSLYLAILCHTMDSRGRADFIARLSVSTHAAHAMRDIGLVNSQLYDLQKELSNSQIYMRLKKLDESAILACALLHNGSEVAHKLTLYLDELKYIKPVLNGNDLIELGVPQGPRVGELLQKLVVARLDDEVWSHETEIDFIRESL